MSTEIDGFSYYALDQLSRAVGARVRDEPVYVDLGEVAAAIDDLRSVTVDRLNGLVDAISNPTATAGDELFRRGLLAWKNAWTDDAERDLRASVAAYPYRAGPHLFLGLTLLEQAEPVEAVEALRRSVKYGPGGDAASAAAAALVADVTLAAAGGEGDAIDLLKDAYATLPQCPHIAERLFFRTGEHSWLESATRGFVTSGVYPIQSGGLPETSAEAERLLEEAAPHLAAAVAHVDALRHTADFSPSKWLVRDYDQASATVDDPLARAVAAAAQCSLLRAELPRVHSYLADARKEWASRHNDAVDWIQTPRRKQMRGASGGFFERRRDYASGYADRMELVRDLKRKIDAVDAVRHAGLARHLERIAELLPPPRPDDVLVPVIVPQTCPAPALSTSRADLERSAGDRS